LSADGTRQVLRVSSERQPPVYYFYDRKVRFLVRLFEQRPAIRRQDLSTTRRVDFMARDGLAIPAYLTLPSGVEPKGLPAIALVHGGPWSRDWIDWDPEVQLLASRGYAVLQVNFRGSSGLGAAYLQAGYREWGQKIQDDITDGVKWLIAQGIADPDRIGITGASYGGYAALVGLVKTPELYRAGAAYAPVTDIELLISDDKWYDWGYEWHQTMIGGERGDKSRLRESSPLRRVAEIRVPVLLGHGTDDQRVHVRQSQRMAEALKKAGKDYQYLEFPDEVHGFLLESNRIRWYTSLADFFDRNLAPRSAGRGARTLTRQPVRLGAERSMPDRRNLVAQLRRLLELEIPRQPEHLRFQLADLLHRLLRGELDSFAPPAFAAGTMRAPSMMSLMDLMIDFGVIPCSSL
jgi:dipeptidyl aminopeptidase/acylaminoacyl peptidase